MVGIYRITNKKNGKVYIGKSNNVHRRWREEVRGQVNEHLKRAFIKYGNENFLFEIIKECEIKDLNILEIELIAEHRSADKKFGYNKTMGGDGGCWNEDVCRAFSEKMKGAGNHFYGMRHTEKTKELFKKRAGCGHWHFGGENSLDTRRKQSETKIGAKNPNAKIVYCFTKCGEFVSRFDCIADASRITGIGYSAIKNCVAGITKTAGGMIWGAKDSECAGYSNKTKRRVLCIETQQEFESITEASIWAGMKNPSGIQSVCKGIRKKAGSYRWKYL